jgi:hypothetical protein
VLHSGTTAHTVFTLPPTFALAHSVLANTPEIGTYELVRQRSTLRRAIASMHVVRAPLPRAQTSSASWVTGADGRAATSSSKDATRTPSRRTGRGGA